MKNKCFVIKQEKYDAQEIAFKISDYINPEGCKRIFVKPNMVIDPQKGEEQNWIATVTNPSLIEAVLIVLKTKVKTPVEVIIGDAPMAASNHNKTLKLLRIHEIIQKYQSNDFQIQLIDIREWHWKYVANMCVSRKKLLGDPKGNIKVNLAKNSAFADKDCKNYEAFDNINPVCEFHNDNDNIYSISASVLEADMFINLPKLKTHRIAGMTCAMKNLVGINSNKNCVPHNTCGTEMEGGDSCPSNRSNAFDETKGIGGFARKILRKKNPVLNYCLVPIKIIYDQLRPASQKIGWGMWYGNDTIWRSIIDLNRIVLYSDKKGYMQDSIQRKYICIADAIVSGEGEGPLHPIPKKTDVMLVSDNPFAVDMAAAEMMGFDYMKIPFLYKQLNNNMRYPITSCKKEDEVVIEIDNREMSVRGMEKYFEFKFLPTGGWIGHIEKENR